MRTFKQYIDLSKKATKRLDTHQSGSCMISSEWITKNLFKRGIKNFKIIEGYVSFLEESHRTPKYQHTWIEIDGKIIDPTLEQFTKIGLDINTVKYIGSKKIYSPEEYLKLCKKFPIDRKEYLKNR